MEKILGLFTLLIIPLLIINVSCSGEESSSPQSINLWFDGYGEEEQEYGGELQDEMDSFLMLKSEKGARIPVNVDSFGAVGDGVADDTQVELHQLV